MSQQVKALAAKADDTRSIPGTLIVEGEEVHKLSSDLHMSSHTTHTDTSTNVIIKKIS